MYPYDKLRPKKKKIDADSIQTWKYGHKNFQNKSRHVTQ